MLILELWLRDHNPGLLAQHEACADQRWHLDTGKDSPSAGGRDMSLHDADSI
jgi:hypothetical protein